MKFPHNKIYVFETYSVYLCRPLQRMVIGMFLGGLAFVIAGVVQFEVQAGDKTLKDGETKLVMFNALSYEAQFSINSVNELAIQNSTFSLPPGGVSL